MSLKLNHSERDIVIRALALARRTWNEEARGRADDPHCKELAADAVRARDLCTRFEEEQS